MFVKICGITRLDDAEYAVACGADAIGFVFWPQSPRRIEVDRARTIAATLPPLVMPVGVFVNQPSEFVNEVADHVGLQLVQLHGDESVSYAGEITRPVLKAVTVEADADAYPAWPLSTMLLLDVHDPIRRGGTGKTIDWTAAGRIAQQRKILLAGGIGPDNANDAIAQVKPFGIDVSSRVEIAPGIKDHARMRDLFAAVGKRGLHANGYRPARS